MASIGPVRAAGGVVERDGAVVLVHRPRYDDWSLPKGKLKRGEHPLLGAVREVHEESGVHGVPGVRLPGVDYQAPLGGALVDKHVDFWAMTSDDIDAFTPNDEVDDLVWLPVGQAMERLSYPRDRIVLGAYAELPPVHRPVALVRPAGAREAATLARLLAVLRPGRLVAAARPRCRETLAPLADSLDIDIDIDDGFDADPGTAALRGLAGPDTAVVVCAPDTVVTETAHALGATPADPNRGIVVCFGSASTVAASSVALVDFLTRA